MILYRGIAVPTNRASKVIADIRSRGLLPDQGRWRFRFYDLKPLLPELRQRSIVTTADTELEGEMPTWVCACGDEMGAIYYATKHNRDRENNTPVLISFDANLRDVIIDGRDFLYRLFQCGNPQRARPVAERAYGREILPYLDRAWATDDQNQRVAMCHLATQDDEVISAHLNNEAVIEGRYNTRFAARLWCERQYLQSVSLALKPSKRFLFPTPKSPCRRSDNRLRMGPDPSQNVSVEFLSRPSTL
jgi:hypothetical protein